MTNGKDPAWPQPTDSKVLNRRGLTKREYFAAQAMQGIMSAGYRDDQAYLVAPVAVEMADALIEELNKTKENHDESSNQNEESGRRE